eukprot:GFUD01005667.1.p1 GENE.GFUD01005667.1~~GFUD01005667.1.p1  ORF type:complete len:929 (+),score=262.59 GFUD01005667.1:112-2898(+)
MALSKAEEELQLFQRLATALGETLEMVCNMQEKERQELITVLGLRMVGTNEESGEGKTSSLLENPPLTAVPSDESFGDKIATEDQNNNEKVPAQKEPALTVLNPPKEPELHPEMKALQQDTSKVLKLLSSDIGTAFNADVVQAYLEAHMDRPDRVQVVVEELAGVHNDTHSPERQPSMELESEIADKSKGKSRKLSIIQGLGAEGPPSKRTRLDLDIAAVVTEPVLDLTTPSPPPPSGSPARTVQDITLSSPSSSPPSPQLQAFQLLDGSGPRQNNLPSIHLFKVNEDSFPTASLVKYFSAMFPEAPLDYLQAMCPDLVGKEAAIERFTDELLSRPFTHPIPPSTSQATPATGSLSPPHAVPSGSGLQPSSKGLFLDCNPILQWEQEKYEQLLSMFPNICPEYLRNEVHMISRKDEQVPTRDVTGDDDAAFEVSVARLWAMTPGDKEKLPTRTQWLLKEKERFELEKWSEKMTPGDFLDIHKDPAEYFTTKKDVSEVYKAHAFAELKRLFRNISNAQITRIFRKCGYLLSPAIKMLKDEESSRKTRRPDSECRPPAGSFYLTFLREKKFVELEEGIKIERMRRLRAQEEKMAAARLAGALVECQCCFRDDCLEEDMVKCSGGHLYCRDCVENSTKVAMGEGKTTMECLGQCSEEISWQELARALQPNVLSKLIQKRQAQEVEQAGIESVVACPFCPYLTIMENEADKVLVCRSSDCGRESCRLCREPNHVPLRCEEVEKGEQVRKKIEEQLTEAMLRECWKCKNKFYKVEGCNKMTCRCGAGMCYLCKKEVKDYSHFYGQGGTPTMTKTCPLFSDNKMLHQREIARAAKQAKQELENDDVTLANDPTRDIDMTNELPISEDEVRDRLFRRWVEVTTRVEEVTNPVVKARLQGVLEVIRQDIGSRQVVKMEDNISRQLEQVSGEIERSV